MSVRKHAQNKRVGECSECRKWQNTMKNGHARIRLDVLSMNNITETGASQISICFLDFIFRTASVSQIWQAILITTAFFGWKRYVSCKKCSSGKMKGLFVMWTEHSKVPNYRFWKLIISMLMFSIAIISEFSKKGLSIKMVHHVHAYRDGLWCIGLPAKISLQVVEI